MKLIGLSICALAYSCSTPTPFFVDIKKQAIVSCNEVGMKKITIKNDFEEITLEGTDAIIYFNHIVNAVKVSKFDSPISNYKLILLPNCNYKLSSDAGYDRGPFTISFRTDTLGQVVHASNESCN